jgi:hypothetical protein
MGVFKDCPDQGRPLGLAVVAVQFPWVVVLVVNPMHTTTLFKPTFLVSETIHLSLFSLPNNQSIFLCFS